MKGFVLGAGTAAVLAGLMYLAMQALWVSNTAAYSPASVTVEVDHRSPLSAFPGVAPRTDP